MIFENAKLSISSLIANKMRTILSLMGIVIGISSVMLISNLGNGMKAQVQGIFDEFGSDLAFLIPTSYDPDWTFDFGRQIVEEIPSLEEVTVLSQVWAHVKSGDKTEEIGLSGVFADYPTVTRQQLLKGEFFTDSDNYEERSVAVLGNLVAKSLFPQGDAIGQKIKIYQNGIWDFEVIGVLKQNDFTVDGVNDKILIPINSMKNRMLEGAKHPSYYIFTVKSDANVNEADKALESYVEEHIGEDTFFTFNMGAIAEESMQGMGIMNTVLAGIAAISLLVGGIGIMNIMLVSVSERIKEIGIRKALGATPGAILGQFLIEAVLLTLFGGLIGIVLGFWGSSAFSKFLKMPFLPDYSIALIAVIFSVAIGVFFGIYPAWRAAKLDPIEALNHE